MNDHRKVVSSAEHLLNLRPFINQVLQAIGLPFSTFVNSCTRVRMFFQDLDDNSYTEEINWLHGTLGCVVQKNDTVFDIAERLAVWSTPAPNIKELEY